MAWVKGQSGNPRGRHIGARDRLTARAIKALDADFRINGAAAIEACREKAPEQYLAIVAKLFPKDTQVSVTHVMSETMLAALRNANDQRTLRHATVIDNVPDVCQPDMDETKALIHIDNTDGPSDK